MSVPTERLITLRVVGDGVVFFNSWKSAKDGKPIYLEETQDMTEAQKRRVVRDSVGLPIGKRTVTSSWGIKSTETALLEALKAHPFCDKNPKCSKPQFLLIDHFEEQEKEEAFAFSRFRLQEAILKIDTMDLKGFCLVVGGIEFNDKKLSSVKSKVQNRFITNTKTINQFFEYFDVSETENGIKSIALKAQYKMEALVIAALDKGALKSEKGTGTISFKDNVIGLNVQDAALHLLDNSKDGKSKFLPQIKSALSGKS